MMTNTNGPIVTSITRTHYSQLDGLRGLAILLVVFYHFSLPHRDFHGPGAGVVLQLAQAGWMGVDLFFVLSGFLITGILVETREQPHYFRNFLGRRFLRIWPLYYVNLFALLILLPAVVSTVPAQLQGMQDKQGWFWLYGANWLFALEGGFGETSGGYFWSLAVEEQFYLLWPFVVFRLSSRALLRTSLALLCVSLVSRIVLSALGTPPGTLYTMTFTHLDGLAIGSCLAVCSRSATLSDRVRRLAPFGVVVGLIGLLTVRVLDHNFFFWSKAMATLGYTCVAALAGALLVYVMRAGAADPLSRIFSSPFMAQCGKYSYALYLVHVPVAGFLFPLTFRVLDKFTGLTSYELTFVVFVAVSFAVSYSLSALSWHFFEGPIMKLKKYFTYSESGPASKPAASGTSCVDGPAAEASRPASPRA